MKARSVPRRRTTDGESPWGPNYAIAAIKESITVNGTAKEVARAVIFETGASLLSRLKRAGYEDTAEAKLGLKRTVAVKAVANHKLLAGFVPAGSFTSTGSLSAFTKVLTPWIGPTAPTEAIAVVLIGFPDLETDGGGGGPVPPLGNASACRVRPAFQAPFTNVYTNGTCQSGETLLRTFPHCATEGAIFGVTEIGSSVTVGRRSLESTVSIPQNQIDECIGFYDDITCNGAYSTITTNYRNSQVNGLVTINNVTLADYWCSSGVYEWRGVGQPGIFGPFGASFPNGYTDALCCTN